MHSKLRVDKCDLLYGVRGGNCLLAAAYVPKKVGGKIMAMKLNRNNLERRIKAKLVLREKI